MIDLYYWPTPNGHKISIFLKEAEIPFTLHAINIGRGEQFQRDFLQIAPNNKIPAIVDQKPAFGEQALRLFESGAILEYLADKTGKFLPTKQSAARYQTLQWLYWQMGGLGPMAGQNHHFSSYAPEKIPYAIDRYQKETNRLYGVLDKQLKSYQFVAGNEYTIADMAIYPWIAPYELQGQDLLDFPNLKRWFEVIANRPAVVAAYELGENLQSAHPIDDEAKKILFGQTAQSLQEKN
ncbi:MAG: glutathione binding-like protein [Oligoflexus sp.]